MIDYIWRINNLDVYYTNETNGGGDFFALEYMDVIKEWYGHVDHAFEWCSGPGFIGYSLLATNICNNISFLEKYSPSVDMCQKTKDHSKFKDKINIYLDSSLDNIPSSEKFDLVVGNPPHWGSAEAAKEALNFNFDLVEIPRLVDILVDQDWEIHKDFFKKIKNHLSKNGKILLQENLTGSNPRHFEDLVKGTGLKVMSFAHSQMYADNHIYYIEIGHV